MAELASFVLFQNFMWNNLRPRKFTLAGDAVMKINNVRIRISAKNNDGAF